MAHQLAYWMENAEMPAKLRAFKTAAGYLFGAGSTVGNGVQGWAPGALFVKTDGSGNTLNYHNFGTKATANFDSLAHYTIDDTGSLVAATTIEAAIQELAQHQQSAQSFIPIPLLSLRETTNFDAGNIAANGGILASDSTPVLDAINAATDGCQRILWASSNNDQVTFQTALPPDFNTGANLVLHARIVSGGTTNAVGFTVDSFFNEGDTKVVDTTGTNQTTTATEVTATIALADVPSGAQTLTCGLTPVAHTTDTLALMALWLEYTRSTLTS
jgi:hypothetical protein